MMDLRELATGVFAAPQLEPSDMAALAAQGVTTVICNRPEMEIPPPLQAAAMQAAAEAAGLAFVFNPITMGAMTMDSVEEQAEAMAGSEGGVVAYCASGTRSAIMWALAQAGQMPTDDILAATAGAGYQLEGMRGQIDALAADA
jgi:uncharacterized protein (TIGR01244 family)